MVDMAVARNMHHSFTIAHVVTVAPNCFELQDNSI